jgi:hypothetical protein
MPIIAGLLFPHLTRLRLTFANHQFMQLTQCCYSGEFSITPYLRG